MSKERSENDLSQWFSTYGLITAERILGKYQIRLAHDELLTAIKTPASFYHRLLHVPLKNVLNGIVLEQANDYHIYVQKIFIDYLLSGESSKDEEAQGASTRDALEDERQKLVTLGEEYHAKKNEHDSLIANSQASLIEITQEWKAALEHAISSVHATLKNTGHDVNKSKIRKAINYTLISCELTPTQLEKNQYIMVEQMNENLNISLDADLKKKITDDLLDLLTIVAGFDENMSTFIEHTNVMNEQANSYRTQFYETILRVLELIKLLPDYKLNPEQDLVNREPLYFDKSIGAL